MSETGSQQPPQEETFSRRDLLTKKAPAAALTLATAGSILNNEIGNAEHGVENENASFFLIPEAHNVGITVQDIPPNLNVLLKEV